jgi:hypothetical protein
MFWFIQAVFRRYLRPEKDYLSFSLLYNNGERSLDLVSASKRSLIFFFRFWFIFVLVTISDPVITYKLFIHRSARTKLRQRCGLQASRHWLEKIIIDVQEAIFQMWVIISTYVKSYFCLWYLRMNNQTDYPW